MFKKCTRSFISLLLVFVLVASVFTISGSAAVYVWGTNQTKSLTFGTKTVDFKNVKTNTSSSGSNKYGEMYLNDGTEKSVEFIIRSIAKNYQKLTFEAYVPAGYVMHFDYRVAQAAPVSTHNFTFAPAGATEDVTYDLQDGYSYILVSGTNSSGSSNRCLFTIQIEGARQEYHAYMENIELVPAQALDVNVKAPENGSVVINGDTTLSSGDGDLTVNSVRTDSGVMLDAAPADGYAFAGYKINDSDKLIAPSGTNYTFFPTASGDSIEAVFVRKDQPQILVGNMNGFEVVQSLRDALDAVEANNYHLIIPITDVTVEDDGSIYTIPSDVTLVVPNDTEHNVYTTKPNIFYQIDGVYWTSDPKRRTTLAAIGATKPYVTLTVSSGVTIEAESGAAVSVGGIQWSPNGGGSACVKGGYGMIVMKEGAQLTIKDGAALYAWGFIISDPPADADSDPSVVCESGAVVYEMFQITDFAGGTITKQVALDEPQKVFPFSQYYVQNIEAKMVLEAGAVERVCGALSVSDGPTAVSVDFIGTEASLFTLESGCAIKYYDAANDRLICRLDDNAAAQINPLSLNVGFDLNSANFQLPISNIGVEIAGDSSVLINQDLQLYPDSFVTLEEGSELEINSNVYVADKATTEGHVMGSVSVKPLVYSATLAALNNGNGQSTRTGDSLDEPYVINNGTVVINPNEDKPNVGSLNLVGEGSTLTGTGSIINNAAGQVEPEQIRLIEFYLNPDTGKTSGRMDANPGENNVQCDNLDAFDDNGDPLPYSYDDVREIWHTDEIKLIFIDDDPDDPDVRSVPYGETFTFPTLTLDGYTLTWHNDEDHDETHAPGSTMEALYFATYVTEWTELPPAPGEVTHSLSLEGQIHVNFYWPLADGEDPADYTYTFSIKDKTSDPLPLPTTPEADGYKTMCAVNAPDMTYDIVATLYKNGSVVMTDTFKAADYATAYNDRYQQYDTELQDNTPYLIGKINGADMWEQASTIYKFTDNPNNSDEYMLANVALSAGDEIKVAKYYTATDSYGYYPDGTGNNYVVDQNGVYNIYFKKNPDGYIDGWHHGKFYVETVSTNTADYQNALLPILLQATVNYGSKAQTYFNVRTDDLADDHISHKGVFYQINQNMVNARMGDDETRAIDKDVFSAYGLKYYGFSLVMNSGTKLKAYFTVEDNDVYSANIESFMVNDEPCTPEAVGKVDGKKLVCFTLSNGVAPANLHERFTLARSGGASFTCSALDYATLAIRDKDASESDHQLYELASALYWYNIYAHAYFDVD